MAEVKEIAMIRMLFFSPQLPYGHERWALARGFSIAFGAFLIALVANICADAFMLGQSARALPLLTAAVVYSVWFSSRVFHPQTVALIVTGVLIVAYAATIEIVVPYAAAELGIGYWIIVRFYSVGPDVPNKQPIPPVGRM